MGCLYIIMWLVGVMGYSTFSGKEMTVEVAALAAFLLFGFLVLTKLDNIHKILESDDSERNRKNN